MITKQHQFVTLAVALSLCLSQATKAKEPLPQNMNVDVKVIKSSGKDTTVVVVGTARGEFEKSMLAGTEATVKNDQKAAEVAYLAAIKEAEKAGFADDRVAMAYCNLGTAYAKQQKFDLAIPEYENSIRLTTELEGEKSINLREPVSAIAVCYFEQDKFVESAPYIRRALPLFQQTAGPNSPKVRELQKMLFFADEKVIDADRSEWKKKYTLAEEAIKANNGMLAVQLCNAALHEAEKYGTNLNARLLYTYEILGIIYLEQNNFEQAQPAFEKVSSLAEQLYGPNDPIHLGESLDALVVVCFKRNQIDKAIASGKRAVHIYEKVLGPSHQKTMNAKAQLSKLEKVSQ